MPGQRGSDPDLRLTHDAGLAHPFPQLGAFDEALRLLGGVEIVMVTSLGSATPRKTASPVTPMLRRAASKSSYALRQAS